MPFFLLALIPLTFTQIDYSRVVEGWPEMELIETKVSRAEASERCRKTQADVCSGTSGVIFITSCYQWNFDQKKAWIWYSRDSDLEHERAHHRGHPHVGEGENSVMACYLKEWKAKQAVGRQ